MSGSVEDADVPARGRGRAEGPAPGSARRRRACPPGTEVFSADDHISLAEDIFYERFPESMKDRAPRVMNVDGGWVVGVDGQSILVREFIEVLTQYDPLPGSHTGDVDARLAALDSEGVDQGARLPELGPRPVRLARPGGPRALLPDLQRAHRRGAGALGRPHLRRRPHQLVGRRRHPPDARRAEGARAARRSSCRSTPARTSRSARSTTRARRWTACGTAIEEAGLPVSHHIGESPPATPNEFNADRHRDAPDRRAVPRHCSASTSSAASSTVTPACASAGSRAGSTGCRRRSRTPSTSPRRSGTSTNLEVQHDPQHYWDEPHGARRSWSTRSGSSSSTASASTG